jgi:hypothetical protein
MHNLPEEEVMSALIEPIVLLTMVHTFRELLAPAAETTGCRI